MGLDVNTLRAQPSVLPSGRTKVTMSYFGIIDNLIDNPVKLTLFIDPSVNAFFVRGQSNVKSISKQETFGTTPQTFLWNVEIDFPMPMPGPIACSLRLEAVDKAGNRSSTNSFIIFN
ncbi:hypothetical protein [Emticicia fontis]